MVGTTIVRVRGIVTPLATPTTSAFAARFTMYVGDNNDVDRGANANDSSYDELSENRDFFFFEPISVPAPNSGAFVNGSLTTSRLIDVRSSRKLEELNQTVILDGSGTSLGNTAESVAFFVDLSMLLMLP